MDYFLLGVGDKLNEYSNSSFLLFIDEIQNSPKAIAMLRYFYEEIPMPIQISFLNALKKLPAKA